MFFKECKKGLIDVLKAVLIVTASYYAMGALHKTIVDLHTIHHILEDISQEDHKHNNSVDNEKSK